MKQIELDISAIRQSDSQNNAYVLLLNEINGNRQLPIVIGWCEARAIAIGLEEKEKVNRPLTHDLFKTFGEKFKIKIEKVIIHTLIEGIFHASFHCENTNTGEKNTMKGNVLGSYDGTKDFVIKDLIKDIKTLMAEYHEDAKVVRNEK